MNRAVCALSIATFILGMAAVVASTSCSCKAMLPSSSAFYVELSIPDGGPLPPDLVVHLWADDPDVDVQYTLPEIKDEANPDCGPFLVNDSQIVWCAWGDEESDLGMFMATAAGYLPVVLVLEPGWNCAGLVAGVGEAVMIPIP